MIAIIDYGMGNLRSVQKAFEFLGYESIVTDSPIELNKADKLILPGVGAFCDAISTIRQKGIDKVIYESVKDKKPLMGICLGMQLLFDKSYENGEYAGLGILSGEIVKLGNKAKIPQIGWNSLNISMKDPIYTGLPKEPYVYFVHSYHLQTREQIVSATTEYGDRIQISAQRDNIFALQFHPEKSGDIGLKILDNFGRI